MAARIHPGGGRKPRTSSPATVSLTIKLAPPELIEFDAARNGRPLSTSIRERAQRELRAPSYLWDPLPPLGQLVADRCASLAFARAEVALRTGCTETEIDALIEHNRASAETERCVYRWLLGAT
jgi:hypothetical protein